MEACDGKRWRMPFTSFLGIHVSFHCLHSLVLPVTYPHSITSPFHRESFIVTGTPEMIGWSDCPFPRHHLSLSCLFVSSFHSSSIDSQEMVRRKGKRETRWPYPFPFHCHLPSHSIPSLSLYQFYLREIEGTMMSEEWVNGWGSFTGQFFPSLPLAISFFILDVNWRDKGREWAVMPHNLMSSTLPCPSLFSRSLHHLGFTKWTRPREGMAKTKNQRLAYGV